MAEPSFTPTFHHTDWVDNVDRVQAGGPNGLNVRLNAIEADLHQVSIVVGQIDAALDQHRTGTTPRQQRVNVPTSLVTRAGGGVAPGAGWFYDSTGAALAESSHRGAGAVMELTLPDNAQLVSFRVQGLYPGAGASFTHTLSRTSATDPTRPPDVLGTATSADPALTNPYDLTAPVDARFALVDNGAFRYVFTAAANLLDQPVTLSLASLQIVYNTS